MLPPTRQVVGAIASAAAASTGAAAANERCKSSYVAAASSGKGRRSTISVSIVGRFFDLAQLYMRRILDSGQGFFDGVIKLLFKVEKKKGFISGYESCDVV